MKYQRFSITRNDWNNKTRTLGQKKKKKYVHQGDSKASSVQKLVYGNGFPRQSRDQQNTASHWSRSSLQMRGGSASTRRERTVASSLCRVNDGPNCAPFDHVLYPMNDDKTRRKNGWQVTVSFQSVCIFLLRAKGGALRKVNLGLRGKPCIISHALHDSHDE